MERDHGNRSSDTERREMNGEAVADVDKTVRSEPARSILRDQADRLLEEILTERAEVFRKLAQ